jgi:hypothetical protein
MLDEAQNKSGGGISLTESGGVTWTAGFEVVAEEKLNKPNKEEFQSTSENNYLSIKSYNSCGI